MIGYLISKKTDYYTNKGTEYLYLIIFAALLKFNDYDKSRNS